MTDNKNTSYPALCALCGRKPTTLSQSMHNAGFRALSLPFVYVAFDTIDTNMAIMAMRELGIRGYSLTIPHKETALPLVDELSVHARAVGAINTVINSQGKLKGYNTDVYGIQGAFDECRVELRDKRVLILGAGGAARAAIWTCLDQGAAEVVVWNRSEARLASIKSYWSELRTETGSILPKDLDSFEVIVNSTPIDSRPGESVNQYPFALEGISDRQVVFDMVTCDTTLLKISRNRGARTISGVRMLLFQALKQFYLFTDCEAPFAVMEEALLKELHALGGEIR